MAWLKQRPHLLRRGQRCHRAKALHGFGSGKFHSAGPLLRFSDALLVQEVLGTLEQVHFSVPQVPFSAFRVLYSIPRVIVSTPQVPVRAPQVLVSVQEVLLNETDRQTSVSG